MWCYCFPIWTSLIYRFGCPQPHLSSVSASTGAPTDSSRQFQLYLKALTAQTSTPLWTQSWMPQEPTGRPQISNPEDGRVNIFRQTHRSCWAVLPLSSPYELEINFKWLLVGSHMIQGPVTTAAGNSVTQPSFFPRDHTPQ